MLSGAYARIVVEDCGAMPDLEDKEGEVRAGHSRKMQTLIFEARQLYIRPLSTAICQSLSIFSRIELMFMLATLMVGRLCIMHARK